MTILKQVKEVPEWFSLLNDNSLVNAKDVAKLFGLNPAGLTNLYKQGSFPPPDTCLTSRFKGKESTNNKNLWTKATLIKEIQRRNTCEK